MSVVWLLIASSLPALAGWVQVGPERGHVLHAAVGPDRVAVATRVGVASAGLELDDWARDPRFPPEVRRLAFGPEGTAWGAPAGQIWRVGEAAERVVYFETATTPVDLATTGSGALVAAVRGAEAGVLRIEGGVVERVLEGVDPWRVAASGERVLVGTVGSGLYLSTDGGRSFAASLETEQGISAVAWVDGEAWAGLSDGGLRVLRDGAWANLTPLRGGYATGFAQAPGGVLITVQRLRQGHDAIVVHDGVLGRELQPGRMSDDGTIVDLTGAWSLPDGRALVGSFRRGPLVFGEGGLVPARDGFRATVTGGAAVDSSGRIVLALMGTGVYVSIDGGASWQSPGSGQGPVTDSVAVVPSGPDLLVVDFEGVARLDPQGSWSRLPRNPLLQPGQNLASVGVDAQQRTWAVDRVGSLFLLEGETWRSCQQRGFRLDGQGAHLVLATPGGFLAPTGCDQAWEPLRLDTQPRLDGRHARAAGGWVAGGGAVWHGSKKTFAIPPRSVTALAAREHEALVALDDGTIQRCAERCEPLPDAVPGTVAALGWLADGRVWVAELTGTFLVQGDGPALPPWSAVLDARRVTGDLMPLERAPWNDESAPQGPGPGPATPGQPGPPQAEPGAPPQAPGAPPVLDQGRGCGCAGQGSVGSGWLLALVGLALSPRRRDPRRR
jgi:MYXO-CTERM domain-containing protein